MKNKGILNEYYDFDSDSIDSMEIEDVRKPRLTLRHVNKMRKVRNMREVEKQQHNQLVQDMYGRPAQDDGGEF